MRFLLAFSFLSLSISNLAVAATDCATLDEIDDRIISCGDNQIAAEGAKTCAVEIKKDWKAASKELEAALQNNKQKNQNTSQLLTKVDYEKTVKMLEREITKMQEKTGMIADYASLLIDYPDSDRMEKSLSCFVSAFNSIQQTVTGLDAEIVSAKKLLTQTLALREKANVNSQNLSGSANTINSGIDNGSKAVSESAPTILKGKGSGISGELEGKSKKVQEQIKKSTK